MTMKKKSKAWIPFLIVILVIAGFIGFRVVYLQNPEMIPGGVAEEKEEIKEESVFAVNTTLSHTRELNEYLEINGDIIATNQVDVYPDTTGKLIRLPVKPGDSVRKDDIVAWIDPSRPGMNFSESPVKSPISGTITAVMGNVGGMAAPQAPLLSVGDLSSLEVRIFIPERFTSRIYIRMPATLSFETFPDQIFNARVSEISPVVDPITRTMEVKMIITGNKMKIKAGMFAEVSLALERHDDAISVPTSCIVNRFDNSYIFTVEGNTVIMQPITVGISEKGFTEILEGLSPEQEIVYQGMNLLEEGSMIRIVNQIETLN